MTGALVSVDSVIGLTLLVAASFMFGYGVGYRNCRLTLRAIVSDIGGVKVAKKVFGEPLTSEDERP